MKIMLSAIENTTAGFIPLCVEKGIKFKWNLMSYYYIKNKAKGEKCEFIRDNSEEILIDSGAHSFQFGIKTNFKQYVKDYAQFIKEFDRPNVVGYFEMDIENVVGMDAVLDMRKQLEEVTDKIIPVWHKNRGIDNFVEMCEQYAGKLIAIGGFRGTDIKDNQYLMFMKEAKKHNCKVHCLGMTRPEVLNKVPFDYTDSASWHMSTIYGRPYNSNNGKKFAKPQSERERAEQQVYNYEQAIKQQEHYYRKWKKVCKD